jgi:hypothetical protein
VVTSFYHGERNHYGFFTQVSNLILQSTEKFKHKNCLLYFVIFIVPFWLRKIGLPNNEPDFNLRLKDDAFKDYNRKREN